ncbi:MAG: hypothetical protein IPJ76_09585 [Flavobacteriales bacterium]|nr:MAG: hypothetical protein IPJ76_09585 [Flavobacteriales bacterium]
MLSQRSLGWIIWSSVVLSACSVFFFRCFLTLDGPVHVLHASALGDALLGHARNADGLTYDLSGLDVGLQDPLAYVLLFWSSPESVETMLAALALFALTSGAVIYARAMTGEHRPVVLLVLPLSFSALLILGFLPFLFGIGICFWSVAWWLRVERIKMHSLIVVGMLLLLCAFIHRGCVPLLVLLIGLHEWSARRSDERAWWARWAILPAWILRVGTVTAPLGLLAYVGYLLFFRDVFEVVPARDALHGLLTMNAWLLLDSGTEGPLLFALGLLVIAALTAACLHLWRAAGGLRFPAPLWAGLALIALSLIVRTPWADLHYVPERAQVLGVVLLVIWAAAQASVQRWSWMLVGAAIVLHGMRTFYLERRMAHFADERAAAAEVAAQLVPGSLAAVQLCADDWLLLHAVAPIMVRYDGIIVSLPDKLPISRASSGGESLRQALRASGRSPEWLVRCASDATCPKPEQVVVFGGSPQLWLQRNPEVARVLELGYEVTGSSPAWTVFSKH